MTLIPFRVEKLTQRWKWDTDVLDAHDGLEQRIANRQIPAEGWNIDVAVDDEEDRRNLRLALFFGPVDPWDLPIEVERVPVKDEVTGTSVRVDATYADWAFVDQAVYVVGPDPEDAYVTTIEGISGSVDDETLTLADSPPAGRFPARLTHIMPIRSILLEDGQPTSRQSAEASTRTGRRDQGAGLWTLSARTVSLSPNIGIGHPTITTFDGLDVLDRIPFVESAFEERFVANLRRYDFGGAISQEWSRTLAKLSRAHRFKTDSDEERQYFKRFLLQRYGMQKEFLLPTWQPDLDLETQPAGGSTLVVTKNPGYAEWFTSLAHKRLMLTKEDGSIECVKATSVVDNMDGTETIHLTTTVGAGVVDRVSLLELARLNDDEFQFDHEGDLIAFDLRALVVQR